MFHPLEFQLLGSGRALPKGSIHSDELDKQFGFEVGFLLKATGVKTRYVCLNEDQIDMAVSASRSALEDAQINLDDIALVICAAAVPYQLIPATAPLFMKQLGVLDGAAAGFDVNSTCLSFLTGFEIALRQLDEGQCGLIVSAEVASRALPWDKDPETAALFGDGAGAVVIRKGGKSRLLAAKMETYPSASDACNFAAGGTRFDYHNDPDQFSQHASFQMDGKKLFQLTAKEFGGFVDRLLEKAGWKKKDVDLVIPHQASPFAIQHMAKQLGFPIAKIIDISADHGNQIAASIPFAFDFARKSGRVPSGSKLLFLGTSAGVSFGGMAVET